MIERDWDIITQADTENTQTFLQQYSRSRKLYREIKRLLQTAPKIMHETVNGGRRTSSLSCTEAELLFNIRVRICVEEGLAV